MKSLRELRTELTGIRISAVNHSLWSIATTINERAREAINDAVRQFEFSYQTVYNSLTPEVRIAALPQDIRRVREVNWVDTDDNRVYPVQNVQHIPTLQTNILRINITEAPTSTSYLEAVCEARVTEFPEDLLVSGPLASSATSLTVQSGMPSASFRSPGFLELTDYSFGTSTRELVRYELALPTGFTNLTRAVLSEAVNFSGTVNVSLLAPVENEAVAVIMQAAEANMYQYWVANRAIYNQYTALAGVSALELSDIVSLVRIADDRAERRYRRIKKAPAPGRARRR